MLTALAILPGILISAWIIYRDRKNPEPILLLILCFIAGMLCTFPAIFLEEYWASIGLKEGGDILQTFALAFGSVAFSEELVKFACLMLFAYPWKAFDEPMDGIVYSVMVSMGFATVENIIYADIYDISTIILRAFTAVPAHAAFAIFMGYHVGLAKFSKTDADKYRHLFLGFAGAIIIHGAYDFFLLQNSSSGLMVLSIIILGVSYFYVLNMVKEHSNVSQEYNPSPQMTNPSPTPVAYEKGSTASDMDSSTSKWDKLLKQ